MRRFEFKVVPVPGKCARLSGGASSVMAETLEEALNVLAVEGWDFFRSETVAMKRGWFSRRRDAQDVLVFRRERVALQSNVPAKAAERAPSEQDAADKPVRARPRRLRPAMAIQAA